MPRIARADASGLWCHVLNRGNGRQRIFHDVDDYAGFLRLVGQAGQRASVRVLGFCLMPNHFHLVVRPTGEGDLSTWMQWLMTSHVRRYHRRRGTSGHIWQGRYKSFVIQPGSPSREERAAGTLEKGPGLWTVLRYVERNPLRAKLVERAEDWPWSSLHWWLRLTRPRVKLVATGLPGDEQRELAEAMPTWLRYNRDEPDDRPARWRAQVNRAQDEQELAAVRRSLERGSPLGATAWVRRIAAQLGLESSLRPRGRPRKKAATKNPSQK
jgi:putative transposase